MENERESAKEQIGGRAREQERERKSVREER